MFKKCSGVILYKRQSNIIKKTIKLFSIYFYEPNLTDKGHYLFFKCCIYKWDDALKYIRRRKRRIK
jgi:hypothetical protein